MPQELVTLKVTLSPHARDIVLGLCEEEGVTLSALIESYAELIEDELDTGPNTERFIRRAREIAADRRRRPR